MKYIGLLVIVAVVIMAGASYAAPIPGSSAELTNGSSQAAVITPATVADVGLSKNYNIPVVPEPMSIVLGMMGLGSVAGLRRTFRKK